MTHVRIVCQPRVARGTPRSAPRLLCWLIAGLERRRQRLALAALSDDLLRDVGLTRSQVQQETRKPFWRS